ncbi:flavin reductase family protein [Arthrobacter sp. ISL-28]|uniref:flavin reductase family protein n=1 Tax=Arthrobacter sp. ISL-28 TaxID=2819108 RepID=UPI0037BEDE23
MWLIRHRRSETRCWTRLWPGVDCELYREYDGGDHTIVVAAVRALGSRPDAEPLLFFKGSYVTAQLRTEALTGAA